MPRTTKPIDQEEEPAAQPGQTVEQKIIGFAEDLGQFLGTTQAKAEAWLQQRQTIAEQLTQVRDTANQLLQQLTEGGATLAAAVRRGRTKGRPPGSGGKKAAGAKPGRPQGRTISPETRRKMADAAKKRWAARKRGHLVDNG